MQPSGKNNITPLPQITPVASGNSAATPPRSTAPVTIDSKPTFPYPDALERLNKYSFNSKLFDGNHFDAFKIKVDDALYNRNYSRLRYIVNNFPGLISKICGDMLFGQPPRITLPEGSNKNDNSEWLENWLHDTDFITTCHETAMTTSYKGDGLFKLRVGILNDPKNSSVIVEQIQPDYFFPKIDPLNITAEPKEIELAYLIQINGNDYLRKEIHTAGSIRNELWKMEGAEIQKQEPLSLLGDPELKDEEDTGIDRLLVIHVPNWKDGRNYFGRDDYYDLDTLFFAINNRMSKIDNILDKHSDPILAIPDGILDDEGHVRREHLGLFEKSENGDVPEYIVWNAQLTAAFDEVEKLHEALYMFSEISPDSMGRIDDATAASGRALKYRMMRTVAKINRKKIYFDRAIKEVIYVAQLLAEAHHIKALGVDYAGAPDIPSIEWNDPIPQDSYEQAQEEELRLASGNQTIADSIINIDHLTEEQAEEKLKAIQKEQKALAPKITVPVNNPPGPTPPAIAVPGQSPSSTPSNQPLPNDPLAKNITVPKTGVVPKAQ